MLSVSGALARLACCVFLALGLARGQPTQALSGERLSSPAATGAAVPRDAIAQVPADAHVAAADDFQRTKLAVRDAAAGSGERTTKKAYRVCRVTAYCDRGTTAAGTQSGVGQCAAPADIPLGSKVYIPELGRTFIVTDRTHQRFRRSTVDIFVPSKEQCRRFGRNFLECEFTIQVEAAAGSGDRLARK